MQKINNIDKVVKEKRKELNISIKELSKKSSISESNISRLENGIRMNPTYETLKKLAMGLNISLYELIKLIELKDIS